VSQRVVVLPPIPALLHSYAGRIDPVAEARAACIQAVSWLISNDASAVVVFADAPDAVARTRGVDESLGVRVARDLLGAAEFAGTLLTEAPADLRAMPDLRLMVFANGSARRSEKAPGHLDPPSMDFDDRIQEALSTGDNRMLAQLDVGLGVELLAAGIEPLVQLGVMDLDVVEAKLLYSADPYGVRYWIATWSCVS